MLKESQVHAGGIVIVELSKDALVDELADLPDSAREEEGVVHHDLEVFALGQIDELLGLRGG